MSNMVVRTNIFSLNAHRNMKNVGLEQRRASNRLSSGYRINSAADDAAGLAISETMRAQIRGLDQASRNAQDGQAMLLTTEGGLEEIGNMLQRVRELLVQASNDTNTQDQRNMIEQEIGQLAQEIGSMQQRVEFNTNRVLAMGPALDSGIANATADIEADGIRVSDAFAMLDANRSAVADAREMLSGLSGTMTFDQMNSRQQQMIERALAAVELDGVTGGTVTNVGTNIPENIAGVTPTDLTPATGASSQLSNAVAMWHALNNMWERWDAADTAHAGVAGNADAAELAAIEELNAAVAAIQAAGFADEDELANFRDDLFSGTAAELAAALSAPSIIPVESAMISDGTSAAETITNLIAAHVTGGVRDTAIGSNDGLIADYLMTLDTLNLVTAVHTAREAALVTAQAALDYAIANDPAGVAAATTAFNYANEALTESTIALATWTLNYEQAAGSGDPAVTGESVGGATGGHGLASAIEYLEALGEAPILVGSTVTNLIGALNDRDNLLADRTDTLNQVRAEMLSAAEVQFGEIRDFANMNTSGNFTAFFQVGANANQGITFDFETVSRTISAASAVANMTAILVANPGSGGGIGRGIEVSPLINQIQSSLDDVNRIRANLGAVQNRMDYTMRSLDISSENLQDSESRVRNADMAREMMRFTMSNVLQQASISMLSQANQMPNNLLQVLR